jgi:hypothetical protein
MKISKKCKKNMHFSGRKAMYLRKDRQKDLCKTAQWYQFDRHLNPENRWVKLVEIIPWDDFNQPFLLSIFLEKFL